MTDFSQKGLRIMKGTLAFLALGVAISATAAPRTPAPALLTQQDVIQGLGERFPNAKNVSKSQNFRVYRIVKDGISYIQINRLDGAVLTAVAMAGSASFVLPVGELPTSQVIVGSATPTASATAAATCPCSAQVVYRGPEGTVIVVYGANGQVIQVVVLPKTQAQ